MDNLIGTSMPRLRDFFSQFGEKPYRVGQVLNWVYHYGVRDIDAMNNLSKVMRSRLREHFYIGLPQIRERTPSRDGSIKYLLEMEDGARVESVWMPSGPRKTLCVSTQVGCRINCSFCMTATMGLKRNLTAGEIIGQTLAINEDLKEEDRVTNVVLMGMGEPLDNYDNLVEALKLMISPEGMRISQRKVTVSTSGLVDKIRKFQEENLHVNLAISLNATDNETRNRLIPINRKYPIEALMDCLREYRLKPQRRLTFEYILLKGINDSDEDARRLARLLEGFACKINLIPFNPFEPSEFEPPEEKRVLEFQNFLIAKNFSTFVRKNRGADILGACGQLAAQPLSCTTP